MPETPAAPATPPPIKKTQEEVNIDVYEKVFLKCMAAAARIITHRHGDTPTEESKNRQVTIAAAIFDRFYNDQTAMKAGQIQAKAMIDGMNQVLEGRR
jgi:hypothetical protein